MAEEITTRPTETIRKRESNPYAFEKLLGVALLGAVTGVLIYYIYNQLGDDTRKVVKEAVVAGVKTQMAKFAQSE